MALEIMLMGGKTFCHSLNHDLESVFYVILWICTHMTGIESECEDLDHLDIRKWCGLEIGLRDLGLIKLLHIAAP
jgi:Fungal protein kinase